MSTTMTTQVARDVLSMDDEWRKDTLKIIRRLAGRKDTFTTDEVWAALERAEKNDSLVDGRALGALMREAAKRGWIVASASYVPSARKACHKRPVRVWESLLRS